MKTITKMFLLLFAALFSFSMAFAETGTETEADQQNGDKNTTAEGQSYTIDGSYIAGTGSAMASPMTSKGLKFRTATNGGTLEFTVRENYTITKLYMAAIGNYAADDASLPYVKVTKVEVDDVEVGFVGGEFTQKGASTAGELTVDNIAATQKIVLYFDNTNASAGTQLNASWSINWERPDATQPIITVTPATLALVPGASSKLSVHVDPASFTTLWKSKNEAVATVTEDGTVTAVAPGTAIISNQWDTDASVEGTAEVTVAEFDPSAYSVTTYDFTAMGDVTLTIDDANPVGAIWNEGNKKVNNVFFCTNEGLENIAVQAVLSGGKGWSIKNGEGLVLASGAGRCAAVGNLKAGQIVEIIYTGNEFYTGSKNDAVRKDDGAPKTALNEGIGRAIYKMDKDGLLGFEIAKGKAVTQINIYSDATATPDYYLVGTMNEWTPADAYKLVANEKAEGEYMITLDLEANAEFKVKSGDTWYPAEGGNYKVTTAGKYTVYFRPDYSGGSDWHYNCIYAALNVQPLIPNGTYYVMNANEGTLISATSALDAKGAPITFTFNAATNTYAIEGADFFAGKQWTIADAVEGMSGFYTISNIDGFVAVSATNTLEQIADGTADAAIWILLQKAYWEDIVNSTYTVAGTKNLTGTENDWDIVDANNMVYNEETGLYEKKFEGVVIESANQPEFKVVQTNVEGDKIWYPSGDNWVITTSYVGGEGIYDITITFDPSDLKEIGVAAVKTGDISKNTYTATFKTNLAWESVYAYAWSGEGDAVVNFLGDWPGTEVTDVDDSNDDYDIYTLTFEATTAPEKIIFSNGVEGSVGKTQTADLEFVDGQEYSLIYTPSALMEEAMALALDDEAVAVGKLLAAIQYAFDNNDESQLQAAIDQFKADNADQEKDETAKVATNGWKKFDGTAAGVCATQFAPAIMTYDGRNAQLAEVYEEGSTAINRTGTIIYQDITGLTNGKYKVGFYGNAFFTSGRGFESPMVDGAEDVAYVFANDEKEFIVANIATSTTENNFRQFDVEVTDGNIKLGMGKENAGTNWHTMQIYQLTWFTTAKEVYAADQTELAGLLTEAKALAADESKTEGKEALNAAIATAEEATADKKNWYNISEIEEIIANMKAAIANFKKANYFIDFAAGEYYVIDAESGLKMAAGHDWGTRGIVNEAGLDLTLTPYEASRTVTIDSRVSNGGNSHFLGSNLYMDSSEWGWALDYQGFGFYILNPDGGKYINIDANNNLVLSDTPREWIIVSKDGVRAQLLDEMAEATKDAPVDATGLLTAPNFNRNDARNAEAWIVSEDCTNKNLSGGNNLNNCAESYHSTFTIMQTVSNAPAGFYQLTAQGFYRQDEFEGEAPAAPVFFANEINGDVPALADGGPNSMSTASEAFTNGDYTIDPITFEVKEDGMMYVGITASTNTQWVIWDNFQLKYFGAEIPTGIKEINHETITNNGQVYNLRGQKVEKAQKGLYIVNGKVVVIK